jgi:hypothetical protein
LEVRRTHLESNSLILRLFGFSTFSIYLPPTLLTTYYNLLNLKLLLERSLNTVNPRCNSLRYNGNLDVAIGLACTDLVYTKYNDNLDVAVIGRILQPLWCCDRYFERYSTLNASKRVQYTLTEKAAIRAHYEADPQLSQRALAQWLEAQSGKPVRQATVSEILSTRYCDLDLNLTKQPKRVKLKSQAHPELERILAEWVFHRQYCNGGGMPKVFIRLNQGLGSGREEGDWHNEYGSL